MHLLKEPQGRFRFHILFNFSVEKTETLVNAVVDEVNRLKNNGPNQTDLDKYVIEQKHNHEGRHSGNHYMLNALESEEK